MENEKNNLAFIDGQNLYLGTTRDNPSWEVDLFKFRKYLLEKYNVRDAYYFLGIMSENNNDLYETIQKANFILTFREHNFVMIGKKKGNVDSDIIFQVMKRIYKQESFDKIILISGDGDYKMLVDFLIEEDRFKKILFPNKGFASSLYKKFEPKYFDYLSSDSIKKKIEYKKKDFLR